MSASNGQFITASNQKYYSVSQPAWYRDWYNFAVLSSRQVHSQLNTLETEMRQFQQKIEESFSSLRTKVGKLDVGEPRASSADRPVSRASRRSRIAAAQAFASNQYSLP